MTIIRIGVYQKQCLKILYGEKNVFIAIMVYSTINSDDMPYVNQVFNLNIYL